MLRGINPGFPGLFPTRRKVVYVFRTRLPVASDCIATALLPHDLHVLSLPLAFILSQDQTLHCNNPYVIVLTITGVAIHPSKLESNSTTNVFVLNSYCLFYLKKLHNS